MWSNISQGVFLRFIFDRSTISFLCWYQHSQTRRNSVDTRIVFIESKSEELLAGDHTEGILTAIDSDILAEPNELGNEFAIAVSETQDIL